MFETVIVAVDDVETGRDAIALAARLAPAQAEVTIAHVEAVASKPPPLSGATMEAEDELDAAEELSRLRHEWPGDAQVSWLGADSVRRGLHDLAAGRDADLLVVGTTLRGQDERLYLGTGTRELLEGAPCPVAVAPAGYAEWAAELSKIGVGYDGSVESEQALTAGRELAAERGATLSAFEAVTPPLRDYRDADPNPDDELGPTRRRLAALGDVEPYAEFDDDPAEGLRRFGASVDLLVLGSHAYGPIDHLLSGSVAERVSDDASCPLLVLPSPRRESVRRGG